MAPLGFSTGCMYKSSLTLDNIISFYSHIGADALEISLGKAGELRNLHFDDDLIKTINNFSYVSIHAPFKGIIYGDNDFSRHVLKKMQEICKELPVKGVVIHPDNVEDFKVLQDSGLPFLIENMDIRKKRGILAAEFSAYSMLYNFGYVLDLKHVYEHDRTMALASEYVSAMESRIKELHISGDGGDSSHVPLYSMDGKEAISGAIRLCPDVPIIIESVFEDTNEFTAKKELEFVKSGLEWLKTH